MHCVRRLAETTEKLKEKEKEEKKEKKEKDKGEKDKGKEKEKAKEKAGFSCKGLRRNRSVVAFFLA